eukprot:8593345-Ditylum_brightwellii.AAC.1
MKKYLMNDHVILTKNPKTKQDLPNNIIIGLYRDKLKSTTYYSDLPEATMPEKNMQYLDYIKPFYSGMFNNGAVFLGGKEKISNKDVLGIVRILGASVVEHN